MSKPLQSNITLSITVATGLFLMSHGVAANSRDDAQAQAQRTLNPVVLTLSPALLVTATATDARPVLDAQAQAAAVLLFRIRAPGLARPIVPSKNWHDAQESARQLLTR
jgi:hypothetical protein